MTHERIGPGTQGQCATGAVESIAGGDCFEDSRDPRNRQPRPLVIERGAVRAATLAELRRLARLGLAGGEA